MGQQESSVYSQSKLIKQEILEDQWMSSDQEIITIDMGKDSFDNPTKNKYNIKLNSDVPANCDMCIMFPNHPLNKKKTLWTQSYLGHLNTFSKELNERIQKSNRDHLEIRISSGDYYYKFTGFVGNLYLWWGEKVNIERINRLQNEVIENVPILVETNGQMSLRSLFIFGLNVLVNLEDVVLNEPIMYPLYCCETDFRNNNQKVIPTMTQQLVNQVVDDPVLKHLRELPEDDLPFNEVEALPTERIPTFVGKNPLDDDDH
jgi:hypothetical protein